MSQTLPNPKSVEERMGKTYGAPKSLKLLAAGTASLSDNEENEEPNPLQNPDDDDTDDEYAASKAEKLAETQENPLDVVMADADEANYAQFQDTVANAKFPSSRKRKASTNDSPRGSKRRHMEREAPVTPKNNVNTRSRRGKHSSYFRTRDPIEWAVAAAEYDNFDRLEEEGTSPLGDGLESEVQTYFANAPGADAGDSWIPEELAEHPCLQDTDVNHHHGVHVEEDVEFADTAETQEMHAERQMLANEFSDGLYNPWIDVDDEDFVSDAADSDDESLRESEEEDGEMTVVSLPGQSEFWLLEEEMANRSQDDFDVRRNTTDFTTYVAADQGFSQDNQPPELGMIEPDLLEAVNKQGKPFPKQLVPHFSAGVVKSSFNGESLEDVPDVPFRVGNGSLGTTMMRYVSRGLTMTQLVARLPAIYHRGPDYLTTIPKTGTLGKKVPRSAGKSNTKGRISRVKSPNTAGQPAVNLDTQRARNALSMRIQRARDREGGLAQGVPGHTKRAGGITKNEKEVYGRPAISLDKKGQPNGLPIMTDEMILFGTIWPVDLEEGTFKQPPIHPTHDELKDGKSNWQNQPFGLSMPEEPTPRVMDILDAIARPYPSVYDFRRGEGVFEGRGPANLSNSLEPAEITKLVALRPLARTHRTGHENNQEAWMALRQEGITPKRLKKKLAGRKPRAIEACRVRGQGHADKREH